MEEVLQLPHVHPPHGGDLKKAALSFGVDPASLSDFSININSLGMPPAAEAAAVASITRCGVYPDIRYEELRLAIAGHYHLAPEQVLPLAGAAEGIFLVASAFRQDPAVIFTPAFNEYKAAASGFGSPVHLIAYQETADGFGLPEDGLPEAQIKLFSPTVYIANPNNPTGHLNSRASMLQLAHQVGKLGGRLVVDESFLDFHPQRQQLSLVQEAICRNDLLVIISLTKFFAMPGLRIGFAVGGQDLLAKIAAIQPSWGIATPAVQAGIKALQDEAFVARTHQWVASQREFLSNGLAGFAGFKVFPGAANFLLLELSGTGRTSAWWQEALAKEGFLLRLCEDFGGLEGRCLRIAVRGQEDNAALLAAFLSVHNRLRNNA